ncbi:hypothetical protein ACFL2A_05145 [Thermodesulfobacteriota bacterium]
MPDYSNAIKKIRNPENIHEAMYASGPYTLMKAFQNDTTVKQLIKGGENTASLIAKELEKGGMELNEISRSCYAFILQNIDLGAAAKILKPMFIKAMKAPDPFFVHFAAHALRQHLKLPSKPSDPLHTRGELLETLERLQKISKKRRT